LGSAPSFWYSGGFCFLRLCRLATLIPLRPEEEPPPVRTIEQAQWTRSFSPVTAELAADLLMDAAELEKIKDLLGPFREPCFGACRSRPARHLRIA
jgi:hypothetical protein